MASVVLSSIETFDGGRCVDIFQREDGTFGFDEFRREPESRTGWFRTGHFEKDVFTARDDALDEAKRRVIWLDEALKILGEHNKN